MSRNFHQELEHNILSDDLPLHFWKNQNLFLHRATTEAHKHGKLTSTIHSVIVEEKETLRKKVDSFKKNEERMSYGAET